jgi:hypothetical protein
MFEADLEPVFGFGRKLFFSSGRQQKKLMRTKSTIMAGAVAKMSNDAMSKKRY